jgi:hypothetical protein
VGDVLDVSRAQGAQKIDLKAKMAQQSGAEQHTIVKTDNPDDENKKSYNIFIAHFMY